MTHYIVHTNTLSHIRAHKHKHKGIHTHTLTCVVAAQDPAHKSSEHLGECETTENLKTHLRKFRDPTPPNFICITTYFFESKSFYSSFVFVV